MEVKDPQQEKVRDPNWGSGFCGHYVRHAKQAKICQLAATWCLSILAMNWLLSHFHRTNVFSYIAVPILSNLPASPLTALDH